MKIAIIGVVPHPGATFPYSELRGLNISPNRVLNAIIFFIINLIKYYITNLCYYKKNTNYFTKFMEIAIVLSIFIASVLLGITGYSIYIAFGPASKSLIDPFEEHEE